MQPLWGCFYPPCLRRLGRSIDVLASTLTADSARDDEVLLRSSAVAAICWGRFSSLPLGLRLEICGWGRHISLRQLQHFRCRIIARRRWFAVVGVPAVVRGVFQRHVPNNLFQCPSRHCDDVSAAVVVVIASPAPTWGLDVFGLEELWVSCWIESWSTDPFRSVAVVQLNMPRQEQTYILPNGVSSS